MSRMVMLGVLGAGLLLGTMAQQAQARGFYFGGPGFSVGYGRGWGGGYRGGWGYRPYYGGYRSYYRPYYGGYGYRPYYGYYRPYYRYW